MLGTLFLSIIGIYVYPHDSRADYFCYSHDSRANYFRYSHDSCANYISYLNDGRADICMDEKKIRTGTYSIYVKLGYKFSFSCE